MSTRDRCHNGQGVRVAREVQLPLTIATGEQRYEDNNGNHIIDDARRDEKGSLV